MPETDALIFDLDGTLWDSSEACAVGWQNVLDRHAIPFRAITAADVRAVAGRPHEACIRDTFVGLSEEHLRTLTLETPEEDNRMVAALGGELYPYVEECLERLGTRFGLYIVSNCQAGYVETFLRWTRCAPLFRDFECWGNTGKSKTENLRSLIQRNGLRRPIFVGDTEGDRVAAEACGVPFVHVTYGFGQCEEAAHRVTAFRELVDLIEG